MFSCATGAPRSLHLLCAIALLLVVPVRSTAQSAGAEAGPVRTALTGGAEGEPSDLNLLVGRSTVVNVGQPIQRVSLTRPEIADVVVTGTQQLLVHGKTPGTISMFVWNHAGAIKRYDVTVARDLSLLEDQLKQLFPGESITVVGNGKSVVVSGSVSSKYVIEKVADVAAGYVEKKDDVVNLLRQQEGVATTQVMLRVRFAEVSRSALTELGAAFFTPGYKDYTARATTQQFAAPTFDDGKLVFSDYLNFFLFKNKEGIGTVIRALQSKGLFESLAEPNLVTENGKEASFLAGGEYPYPVVQGTGSNLAVTIVFKEYGIRLNFTPTLMGGDLVHLKVRPEVSSLDFGNSVTYQGFRIPALTTRRADTEIELVDGQTFAIAGLLNNTMTSTMQKIPGIGDIPILGLLFRSKAARKDQTELVVMITPQILRRGSMGAATGLPNLVEPYLEPPKKTFPNPPARLPGGEPQQKGNDAPQPVAGVTPVPVVNAPARVAEVPAPARAQAPSAAVTPRSAASAPAPSAPPAPAQVGVQRSTAAVASPGVAPGVSPANAAPAPKGDEKKLAEERKAADKAAERKREEDRKAAEDAAKELRARQEAEGRELARQREVETRRRAEEAKAAEERKRADAKAAEEQHKADLKRAEEQVKAERARLALAQKEADEARKLDEKAEKERARRDAEVARQVADAQKKQNDAEKKRVKEIQDAVERLNAAQAAYQAAIEKVKKDGAQQ